MDLKSFLKKFYVQLIALAFFVFSLFALPNSERVGDRLQYAIPLIGLACSFEFEEAGEYTLRYALGLVSVHAVKNGLPDEGINLRPDGGGNGFPSGHSYSAAYGASYLARQCSKRVPYLGTIAVLGAAFTGASRVESDKHNSWQVLFGLLFGAIFDQAFRKKRLTSGLRRLFRPKSR